MEMDTKSNLNGRHFKTKCTKQFNEIYFIYVLKRLLWVTPNNWQEKCNMLMCNIFCVRMLKWNIYVKVEIDEQKSLRIGKFNIIWYNIKMIYILPVFVRNILPLIKKMQQQKQWQACLFYILIRYHWIQNVINKLCKVF